MTRPLDPPPRPPRRSDPSWSLVIATMLLSVLAMVAVLVVVVRA